MKQYILVAIIALCTLSCVKDDKLITAKRVSNLELGDAQVDVFLKLDAFKIVEATDIEKSGFGHYFYVYDGKKLILCLEIVGGKLTTIQALDRRFFTMEGTRIGDTGQEFINQGHIVLGLTKEKKALWVHTPERGIYYFFEKRMSKSKKIGRDAKLLSVSIGNRLNVYEKIQNRIDANALSQIKDSVFISKKFNLELKLPSGWSVRTKSSGYSKVKELLFLSKEKDKISLMIIAEELKDETIKNGVDYFALVGNLKIKGLKINTKPVNIANSEFYSATLGIEKNGEIENQMFYCTVTGRYAILLTGKYYDSSNEDKIKDLIFSLRECSVK